MEPFILLFLLSLSLSSETNACWKKASSEKRDEGRKEEGAGEDKGGGTAGWPGGELFAEHIMHSEG